MYLEAAKEANVGLFLKNFYIFFSPKFLYKKLGNRPISMFSNIFKQIYYFLIYIEKKQLDISITIEYMFAFIKFPKYNLALCTTAITTV